MRRRVMLLVVVLSFAVASCEDSGSSSATQPESATSTTVPAPEAGETWDLLYIQDSHGFGVADLYAQHIQEVVGVQVVVHDKAIGDLAAATILDNLRGDLTEDWTDLVRNAEVIVFFGDPFFSGATSDIDVCLSASPLERDPPVRYSQEDWEPYRQVLDQVYDRIWTLRDHKPVVLRAVGFLNPAISMLRQAGIATECTAALEAFNLSIQKAAVAGGATFVSTYDLFNGPSHDQDPRERGWIGPDGLHLTVEGQQVIADGLAAAGFNPNPAP